ncbi:hypothetical protein QAD02_002671 [Eretmocerus hayati]|uniref:Uncharacterized protein n=1 Tax=Eretmocerus hayati TaxID=131215 RepID=A0ACC2NMF9_9HYME|nr:hypothetical protein QAD02_002671 [Eretmocerus hayati]
MDRTKKTPVKRILKKNFFRRSDSNNGKNIKKKIQEKSEDSLIKKKIFNTSEILRKKYRDLKIDKQIHDNENSEVLQPLTKQLQEIIDNTEILHKISDKVGIKRENSNEDSNSSEEDDDEEVFKDAQKDDDLEKKFEESMRVVDLPRKSSYNQEILGIPEVLRKNKRRLESPFILQKPKKTKKNLSLLGSFREASSSQMEVDEPVNLEKSVHEMMNNPEGWPNYLDFVHKNLGSLSTEYFTNFFVRKDGFDKSYGPFFDGNILKIGRSTLMLEKETDRILIDSIHSFRGTRGLYELLFMTRPNNFDAADSRAYKQILEICCAHKIDYDPKKKTKSSRGFQYKKIIRPLIENIPPGMTDSSSENGSPKKLSHILNSSEEDMNGTGLKSLMKHIETDDFSRFHNENNIEYLWFDDPNELTDRLYLILAAIKSSDNNLFNECHSIIEE